MHEVKSYAEPDKAETPALNVSDCILPEKDISFIEKERCCAFEMLINFYAVDRVINFSYYNYDCFKR